MVKQSIKKGKSIHKTLKENLLKDFKIKIICFLFAICSYIFIGIIQRDNESFICDLKIERINDGLIISNSIPATVKITVYDRKAVFSKINKEDFNVKLNINADEPGNYNYHIEWTTPKDINSFFSVIEVVPDVVNVHLERLVEKSVPTNLNYYNLEPNYSIKDISISPQYVRISGPESYINSINYIDTEKINLKGEFDSIKREIPIPPHNNLRIIGKNTVTVSFSIVSEKLSRRIECHNLLFKNLNSNFIAVFKNPPIYVNLMGNKQILSEISNLDVNISVDCSSIKNIGEYKMAIEVPLLKNVEITSVNPNVVTILISSKNIEELEEELETRVENRD